MPKTSIKFSILSFRSTREKPTNFPNYRAKLVRLFGRWYLVGIIRTTDICLNKCSNFKVIKTFSSDKYKSVSCNLQFRHDICTILSDFERVLSTKQYYCALLCFATTTRHVSCVVPRTLLFELVRFIIYHSIDLLLQNDPNG